MRKTFKREVAIAALAGLLGLALYAMTGDDPALVEARSGIVSALALPVFLFAMAAFGLDAAAKQLPAGARPFSASTASGDAFPPDSQFRES